MSRSRRRRSGRFVRGSRPSRPRRTRLSTACAARPRTVSGRSHTPHAAPTATISTNSTAPASAARVRCGSTATPPSTAGSDSRGRASSVPNRSRDEAVIPDAAAAAGTPERTSIAYCIAPDAATPPGTTRPNALDASCEVATGPRCSARTASRCTPHIQAKLPAWRAIITGNQSGLIWSSSSKAPNTSSSAGKSRYSDTAEMPSSNPRRVSAPADMFRRLRGCRLGRRWRRLARLHGEGAHVDVLAQQDLYRRRHRDGGDRADHTEQRASAQHREDRDERLHVHRALLDLRLDQVV